MPRDRGQSYYWRRSHQFLLLTFSRWIWSWRWGGQLWRGARLRRAQIWSKSSSAKSLQFQPTNIAKSLQSKLWKLLLEWRPYMVGGINCSHECFHIWYKRSKAVNIKVIFRKNRTNLHSQENYIFLEWFNSAQISSHKYFWSKA